MQLNEGQQTAIAEIQHWLSGTDPYYFLSGQAGTGKSFLASVIRGYAMKELHMGVHITATTNKAAAVLAEMVPSAETSTIYSLLGLRVVNNFSDGSQSISKQGKCTAEPGALVLVDEASMVDPVLMDFLNDAAFSLGLRVLFLGDAYQLPPVNAGTMPVVSPSIQASYLTEIMRANKREDLEEVYRMGREMVIEESGVFMPAASNNVTILQKEGSKDYLAQLLKEDPHTKVLGYTNQAVNSSNMLCRELLGLPDTPMPGDILSAEDMVMVNGERLAYIGQEFEVESSTDTTFSLNGTHYPAQEITTTCGRVFARAQNPVDRTNCMKALANSKSWREYFLLKETIADLRFTHASTVHKSQGSTYDNVLVLTPNILTCPGHSTRRRLLYVAYTRASHHLHVMTQ